MEFEEMESTDSGPLSGHPDSDCGGDYDADGGVGGGGMGISLGKSEAAVEVGFGGGGGDGDLTMSKKKRGRPRKFDANGNLNPAYIKSYEKSSALKRGRLLNSLSANSLSDLFANTAGGDFTPHVITVHTGEDVAGKILNFTQKGHRGICLLSANGSVSNVTLRQPGSSAGLLTYEGRFEILTLTGSFTVSDGSGGLTVTLASPDGRVIGGGVVGLLIAASAIQIVVGSFVPNGFKMPKRKQHSETRMLSPATLTATPLRQPPPDSTGDKDQSNYASTGAV